MGVEIYGTFGPSCKSREVLEEMIKCGMTGMRLNLSHSTLEKSREYIVHYKQAAKNQGIEPQILIDMQGPELRVGDMKEQLLTTESVVELVEAGTEKTDVFEPNNTLKSGRGRKKERVVIPVPIEVIRALTPDMEILLDDGKIRILVTQVTKE